MIRPSWYCAGALVVGFVSGAVGQGRGGSVSPGRAPLADGMGQIRPSPPTLSDFQSLYRPNLGSRKGEYETTASFLARMVSDPTRWYALEIPITRSPENCSPTSISYSADDAAFIVSTTFEEERLILTCRLALVDKVPGKNGFGVAVRITRYLRDGTELKTPGRRDAELRATIPVSLDSAPAFRKRLRIVVWFQLRATPEEGVATVDVDVRKATTDNPSEISTGFSTLYSTGIQVAVVDARTNQVIAWLNAPNPYAAASRLTAPKTTAGAFSAADTKFVAIDGAKERVYYLLGCAAAKELPAEGRIYFKNDTEARMSGRTPSSAPGCKEP